MKLMKKISLFALSGVILSGLFSVKTQAAQYATIPTFKVTLNDRIFEGTYSQYPLLVYKDITYFPMTYYTTRFLGVETSWNSYDGLGINQTGIRGEYHFYGQGFKNANSYPVEIPTFKIKVNGKSIYNQDEKYPLLIFRDVTYFPMTWRFCVDEFGWAYRFTNENGLEIKSINKAPEKAQPNPQSPTVKKELPPIGMGKLENDGKYIYYFREGNIIKVDEKDFSQKIVSRNVNVRNNGVDLYVLDGNIYYIDGRDNSLMNGNGNNLNYGYSVESIEKSSPYFIANFSSNKDGSMQTVIYDKNQKNIYTAQDIDLSKGYKIDKNIFSYTDLKGMAQDITLK